jgi:hypothetical protein
MFTSRVVGMTKFAVKDNVEKTRRISIKSVRRNLVIALIGSIIMVNSIVAFSGPENRIFFANWTVSITLLIALGLVILVAYRQKTYGLGRMYFSLVIGLALWFITERIYAYNEFGSEIETSFPSVADALRLSGFAFIGFHLFRTYHLTSKSLIPYGALLSFAVLTNAIAYGGSVYMAETVIAGQMWLWHLLYNASYLCIAVTLFWHNRFFIFRKRDEEEEGSGGKIIKSYVK